MEISIINAIDTLEDKVFSFPTFFITKDSQKFYFKNQNFKSTGLNFVRGTTGKSLYFQCLTGLEKPLDTPEDLTFLNYNIVYKTQSLIPKSLGTIYDFITLNDLKNHKLFNKYYSLLSIKSFENILIRELNEKQIQLFSIFLFFLKTGDIYILDYPTNLFEDNFRYNLCREFKSFCDKYHKLGFIVESNENIIKNISKTGDSLISFNSFNDNEFYNQIISL